MVDKLAILGAGGHGKVIADMALLTGYTDVIFFDDNQNLKSSAGFQVKGGIFDTERYDGYAKIVAIGDAKLRKQIQQKNRGIVKLIHPAAVIGRNVHIGDGTVVMAGAIINTESNVLAGCIINTGATVDHNCNIGSYAHISVGAHLAGNVTVGDNTWIGAGAIVVNNVSICSDCIIGAGAVVVRDINEPGVYIGVPAKKLEK